MRATAANAVRTWIGLKNPRGAEKSQFGFKLPEAALQFPLLGGLLAGLQKRTARWGRLFTSKRIFCARRNGLLKAILRVPQAYSRKKGVFQACPHHLLEVPVAEAIGLYRSHIFVRQVDS